MPIFRVGNGVPKTKLQKVVDIEKLRQKAGKNNKRLLKTLKVDDNADELLAKTRADAALHRMSDPVSIDELDLDSIILSRRFAVVQGDKVRPVDDLSASG